MGARGEQADDLPATVSFDGLCGLVSVAQMSALGPFAYDSSTGADTFCSYSLSSYEDDHTATVSLDAGFVLEDFAAVAGEVRELRVDGQPALAGAGQLAVQVGADILRVEVDLGSDPPAGLDALDQARRIAGLFIPDVGSFAEKETGPEASVDADASAAHEARLRPS